jgi:O-methyltransferase domain
MFSAVPSGGDAYVVKNVLMDEDDAGVCTILRACRSVIGTSGRLIVIERLLTDPNRSEINLSDMTMLVMTGGRERTLSEFTALFAEAGFHLEQSVATRSPSTLLIGAPV